jgi:hypothetical protein
MDVAALTSAVESHLMTLGQFDHVAFHEPKNAPGNNLTAAVFLGPGGPAVGSGLAATDARVSFTIRIYNNMLQEPQDGIDRNILKALDAVINAYQGDFQLGANVKAVDLLGMAGDPLSWQPGYITQDSTLYRVVDITLPLLIANAWTQAA